MSIVNCTKIMSGYLCLQRRLSQLSEGIEIINRILPYCQPIVLTLHSLQTEVEVIAANQYISGLCGKIASANEYWLRLRLSKISS